MTKRIDPSADEWTVRFVMDEAYLREFHAEMVATRLPRWRFNRSGWFVTYDIVQMGTEPEDEAVSTEKASAYLPEVGFEPRPSRDAFASALADGFRVRRLR